MILLILFALVALLVVYAVFFVLCKLGWLLFKNHSNKGPLITAGVCTFLVTALVTLGTWMGVRMLLAPFQGIIDRVQQNPAPIYGERFYQDETYPFTLTVYDGMDFADWISLGEVQLKLGIDTNAFKKTNKDTPKTGLLLGAVVRQADVNPEDPFKDLQQVLTEAQNQRKATVNISKPTRVGDMPAYTATGEGYSNQGKYSFILTAVQAQPQVVYYVVAVPTADTPALLEQATHMVNSFRMLANE